MVSVDEKLKARAYDNSAEFLSRKKGAKPYEIYMAEEARIVAEFKKDCLEDLGLTNHPKGGLLFTKAWAAGHGYGYAEVWVIMQDWAELLRD